MSEEDQEDQKEKLIKNYVIKQKFGKKRNDKPKWKDPNPVKYGGKYGLMNLQENADDSF